MATLTLKKAIKAPEPAAAPEVIKIPVFDPERLAVQTYSAEGGQGFIQGNNLFSASGRFIREVPESQAYRTTPEQEENNRKARARNRQIFGRKMLRTGESSLPVKLLNAARENMRVLAAESLAE